MTSLSWPAKDPDEVLDYQINWSASLYGLDGDDTITASTWIVPAGIAKNAESHNDDTTTIWLSGGTAGSTYEITNRITTAAGRVMDQTVLLKISDQ